MCSGQVQRQVAGGDPVITQATLYAQVETYRWIMFWLDHDAMISWEVQPGGDIGFGYYNHSNFGTPITDLKRQRDYGSFSRLSNRIYVATRTKHSTACASEPQRGCREGKNGRALARRLRGERQLPSAAIGAVPSEKAGTALWGPPLA